MFENRKDDKGLPTIIMLTWPNSNHVNLTQFFHQDMMLHPSSNIKAPCQIVTTRARIICKTLPIRLLARKNGNTLRRKQIIELWLIWDLESTKNQLCIIQKMPLWDINTHVGQSDVKAHAMTRDLEYYMFIAMDWGVKNNLGSSGNPYPSASCDTGNTLEKHCTKCV